MPALRRPSLLCPPRAVCGPGKGGAKCPACPVGTWSAGGTYAVDPQPACKDCPTGSTTPGTGSSAVADCKRGSRQRRLLARWVPQFWAGKALGGACMK